MIVLLLHTVGPIIPDREESRQPHKLLSPAEHPKKLKCILSNTETVTALHLQSSISAVWDPYRIYIATLRDNEVQIGTTKKREFTLSFNYHTTNCGSSQLEYFKSHTLLADLIIPPKYQSHSTRLQTCY